MKIDFSKPETTEFIRVWWLSFVLTPIAVYFMVTRGTYTFADNAELFVHEMGHLVFAPMGAPLRMAGGTLLQIIVPLGLAVYAYSYDYRVATQLFVFWLGHSLINVSVYAADARAMSLPLVSLAGGGDNVMHDWHWMLDGMGILEWDAGIGVAFWIAGGVSFIIAIAAPKRMW